DRSGRPRCAKAGSSGPAGTDRRFVSLRRHAGPTGCEVAVERTDRVSGTSKRAHTPEFGRIGSSIKAAGGVFATGMRGRLDGDLACSGAAIRRRYGRRTVTEIWSPRASGTFLRLSSTRLDRGEPHRIGAGVWRRHKMRAGLF